MATIKSLVGDDDPISASIMGMGPAQREAYIQGVYRTGRTEFSRAEYAAFRAAQAMDSQPTKAQFYGARNDPERQVPDAVAAAYNAALHDGTTKIPVPGVDDFVYITDNPRQGRQAAAPGGSALASVLSMGNTASAARGMKRTPDMSK